MAKIKVIRKTAYADNFRKYKLFLDEKEIEPIARNETKEFGTTTGIHKMMAKIDWGSSKEIEFDIKEGETKTFEISSFPLSKWIMPISAVLIAIDIILGFFFRDFELFFYMAIPGFLLLMYYITLGRSKYLSIRPPKTSIRPLKTGVGVINFA